MSLARIEIQILFLAVVSITSANLAFAQSFTLKEYRRLHGQLQSSDQEPWRSIPWETSLLAAQNQAAIRQKPIFIWAMDGHPLGCT